MLLPVAVTVMVLTPAGVCGGLELPPPHPSAVSVITKTLKPTMATGDSQPYLFFVRLHATTIPIIPTPLNVHSASTGRWLFGKCGACRPAFGPVVFTARVTGTGVPLGVTDVGVNVHVDRAGKPEQLNDTALLKPPPGVTVKVKLADWPALTLALAGLLLTLKSGGVTTLRRRVLPESSQKKLPRGSTASPAGKFRAALAAGPPSPEKPAFPSPPT